MQPALLFTRHLTSVRHEATGIFLQLFPLLARDSTLSIPNKITLYTLSIRSVLTYAAPVWSNTSSSSYCHLQILQSKCLRVIGNYPMHTPIPRLHATLNVAPIGDFISHLTNNFFSSCPAHPDPPRLLHRKLHPSWPPLQIYLIHAQTTQAPSSIAIHPTAAVSVPLYLFLTATLIHTYISRFCEWQLWQIG
jgi:hypothetical protein